MKILHIEDTEIFTELAKDMFEGFDIVDEYVSVENGLDGVKLALNNKWNLIIVDYHLPKLNGAEIIKLIRRKKIKTPIIANSSSHNYKLMKSGADEEMEKNFSNESEWYDLIKKYNIKSNPTATYVRVVPRDLFNEAKLLKCLGKISISIHNDKIKAEQELEMPDYGFIIVQNDSGDISCENYHVYKDGLELYFFTPLNSRLPWPLVLQIDDELIDVFEDDGSFTDTFLGMMA